MTMTMENMMYEVVKAYGHESKEAIWFCNAVENNCDGLDITIMYNQLMRGRK